MPIIVLPSEGLKGIESSPETNRRYYADLTASRLSQLERVRARLAEELRLPPAVVARPDAIHLLPGAGCLIFDDRVVDARRLKALAWVEVVIPVPLLPVVTGPLSTLQQQPQPWHLSRVSKPRNLNGTGNVIGVVDSGYDPVKFPELTFTAVSAIYGTPGKVPTAPAPAGDQDPTNLHGSGVCAFLAGSTSGMAPGANLAVAVVPPPGSAMSNSAALYYCIDWLLTHSTSPPRWGQTAPSGCDVINLSQASTAPGMYSTGLDTPLNAARAYNTLVVASIGNSGSAVNQWQCPGAHKSVLAVGAVDQNDIVDGSAWGIANGVKRPDLVAPGVALEQPAAVGPPTVLRTGTSFAAPLVAGAAALVMQQHPGCRHNVVALTAKLTTLVRPAVGTTTALAGSPLSDAAGAGVLDLSTL